MPLCGSAALALHLRLPLIVVSQIPLRLAGLLSYVEWMNPLVIGVGLKQPGRMAGRWKLSHILPRRT